jgi:hypothetical protein
MPSILRLAGAAAIAAILTSLAGPAFAHGVAGPRFFPATIATDDPAVADELSLPTLSSFKDADGVSVTGVFGEWSKRLTSKLGLSFEGGWTKAGHDSGFENLETTLKYQFLTSAEHEAIVSAGLGVEWGGTGAERIGAEEMSAVIPSLYFGKGFGDLPAGMDWARPFAVTGLVGYVIPTKAHEEPEDEDTPPERTTRSLEYGMSLQYSMRYLASQVKDYGYSDFVNRLTPLVEVALESPIQNAHGERTTGSVNPGVLWTGRRVQLGLEAQFPVNRDSGKTVGALFQVHWFLDDLFPNSLGRPLW